ncbi:tRNA (uridine(34)/cytosine(34)/5-carboxymethylaminomethyluridine(34)-2'-O)-methyltransferase TrmL [Microbulbifer thermotolerans]|uniref:tRNA (uridine(34)/cytosine(34)/5- carboxymethylaminomethyluridine(34)-2'-O)- methyltransferase TrmL n=1 Tax=Microbulbifer thermotolerans TaxID=252514 RepID=UPI002671C6B3|nr:tRNA (uridine(34)/cytosine(34)/5-carboxymethylaminomethyluridine(34)-2'-O)-methyltransferase TrmL [Microbulbifer thermotolerans]WKT59286.1 tRNA (uridine(34)/cytosine(34)/5-carboxymethylaminomethyluridine(34)-2'-O)-methyltransferase TrmL [Microbulbifer thermotolerans]
MFKIVLYQPEIAPNTGNIIRLCANTGAELHLIEPLGFAMDDKRLRRAGLDYGEYSRVRRHRDWAAFTEAERPTRILALSTKGRRKHTDIDYRPGDAIVFGPETRGLPADFLQQVGSAHTLRIPMRPESRSMNLSNAAAVVIYEAWRQLDYAGAATQ